ILIYTARREDIDHVLGLELGADDYVVKPLEPRVLLARIEALLRRAGAETARPDVYRDGALSIDYSEHRVRTAEGEVALTPLEFRLLAEFVQHPRQVLSHEQLLSRVWHDPLAAAHDQVRLYVGYLRRKLGDERHRIETVRGFGYRYLPSTRD
ncbi:MAG: hypothetical protein QOG59_2978, partial [Solirubrobacteraceae bacterium]|nr:hypothetical protein [Solirubrobacteraceae bacterium]